MVKSIFYANPDGDLIHWLLFNSLLAGKENEMKITHILSAITIAVIVLTSCGGYVVTEMPPDEPASTEEPAVPESPSCPGLSRSMNTENMVTYALPNIALQNEFDNGVILQVFPPTEPPTKDENELFSCEIIIGSFNATRDLPLSDGQILPAGDYWVSMQQGEIYFINNNEEQFKSPSDVDFRTITSREINPPEAIITTKDICYSWLYMQVCTEPIPNQALSNEELGTIQGAMNDTVTRLAEQGLLSPEEINIYGTVPDMAGFDAVELQQASLLAAPTTYFPDGDMPVDGALLGVVYVVLDVQLSDYPTLPIGVYAVRAAQIGENEWEGLFTAEDGTRYNLPATYAELRGQIEEPMAIIIDLRMILCWFREKCKK